MGMGMHRAGGVGAGRGRSPSGAGAGAAGAGAAGSRGFWRPASGANKRERGGEVEAEAEGDAANAPGDADMSFDTAMDLDVDPDGNPHATDVDMGDGTPSSILPSESASVSVPLSASASASASTSTLAPITPSAPTTAPATEPHSPTISSMLNPLPSTPAPVLSPSAGPSLRSAPLGLGLGLGQPPHARGRGRVTSRGRGRGRASSGGMVVGNGQGSGLLRFGFTRVATPTGGSVAVSTSTSPLTSVSASTSTSAINTAQPQATVPPDAGSSSSAAPAATVVSAAAPSPSHTRTRTRDPSECPSPSSSDSGYVEYIPVHNTSAPRFVPFVPTPSLSRSTLHSKPSTPASASAPATATTSTSPPTPTIPTTTLKPTPTPTQTNALASASTSASSPSSRRQPPHPLPLPLPLPSLPSTINLASSPASSPLTPVCPSDAAPSPATDSYTPSSAAQKPKGKGRAEPERRVLPARIRRAAGAGAEAVRELEEMIVDWLERFGDINSTPPESLPIFITTLPHHLLHPKPYIVEVEGETKPAPAEVSIKVESTNDAPALIETPSWVLVTAGEDDQMEARDEMTAGPNRSPSKRLRHGVVGSQLLEDTSDAHYEAVHKKMETFERRQRIREIDKLKFLRHKMNSRIDLLRTLQPPQWNTVVNNVLARSEPNDAWARGRKRLEVVGIDWLRRRLIREGVELLRRYDQLLPGANDHKKQRMLDANHMSPSLASSASPPPTRRPTTPTPEDELPRKRGRPRKSTQSQSQSQSQDTPSSSRRQSQQPQSKPPSTSGPSRRSSRRTRQVTPTPSSPSSLSDPESSQAFESPDEESEPESFVPTPPPPKIRIRLVGAIRASASATPPLVTEVSTKSKVTPKAPAPKVTTPRLTTTTKVTVANSTPLAASPLMASPLTASPIPALLEAARRREEVGPADTPTRPQRALRERTRTSSRLSGTSAALLETIKMNPFGVPMPAMVENQAEFSLNEMHGFESIVTSRASIRQPATAHPMAVGHHSNGDPMVAQQQAQHVPSDHAQALPPPVLPPPSALPIPPHPLVTQALQTSPPPLTTRSNDTEDEMRDMEGVEASVLNTDGSDSCSA